MLGLRFCARAFYSWGKRRPFFIAVHGPLTIAASLVAEHRLQTRRLTNCGSRAQWLRGMWDLPRPGLEPASPASAGRLSTTAPPGKTYFRIFQKQLPSRGRVSYHLKKIKSLSSKDPPSRIQVSSLKSIQAAKRMKGDFMVWGVFFWVLWLGVFFGCLTRGKD